VWDYAQKRKDQMKQKVIPVFIVLFAILLLSANLFAKEASQEFELVNPESAVKVEPMNINAHPTTLEGQTIVLRANGKHNSDKALDMVAELLQKQVKGVKIVKLWEVYPESNVISQGPELSKTIAEKIATYKPVLVINSSSD
jgi:hypothetical protein